MDDPCDEQADEQREHRQGDNHRDDLQYAQDTPAGLLRRLAAARGPGVVPESGSGAGLGWPLGARLHTGGGRHGLWCITHDRRLRPFDARVGGGHPLSASRSRYSGISCIGGRSGAARLGHDRREPLRPPAELRELGGGRRGFDHAAESVEALPGGQHDLSRCDGEQLVGVVTVDAPAEVDLRHPVQADQLADVHQQAEFDAVAAGEGHLLEDVAAGCVLTAERPGRSRRAAARTG